MDDPRPAVRANMRALVQGLGCLDSVSSTIEARWGHPPHKGVLSRRMGGDLDWSIFDVFALEDATNRYPITDMLHKRRVPHFITAPACSHKATAAFIKEGGEAASAVLLATNLGNFDEADAEIAEARHALDQMEAANKAARMGALKK